MDKLILVRYGETWLKSPPVRQRFEQILAGNMRSVIPGAKFHISPGRIWIRTERPAKILSRIFGVEAYSEAFACEKELDSIKSLALKMAKKWKKGTFAVRARRTDKSFPLTSREIENQIGKVIDFPCDLSNPKNTLHIEIRDQAYLYDKSISGPGGLPLGTGGRAACLLRDADDLLAAWLVARRGVVPIPIKPKKALLAALQKWCVGRRLRPVKSLREAQRKGAIAIVDGRSLENSKGGLLVLNPLVGFSDKSKKELLKKIRR